MKLEGLDKTLYILKNCVNFIYTQVMCDANREESEIIQNLINIEDFMQAVQ